MFSLTLANISLEQILRQLIPLQYLDPNESEWLWKQKNQNNIKKKWLQDNCDNEDIIDFSRIVTQNRPIVFLDYYGLYPVGYGAAGVVYKAWQVSTPNIVALKQCFIGDNYSKERFYREIALWKKLSHPHILPLLEGGEEDGNCFLVTPYIDGSSLEKILQRLPIRRTIAHVQPLLQYVLQVAQSLEYAHSQNILHRDVKPGNILVQKEHAYLMDFGLAREINISNQTRLTRGAVGTPLYMAPEIWKLQAVPQSDIYSLCVVIYEILSGSCPFHSDFAEDIYLQQLSRSHPPPPSTYFPLPQEFIELLLSGLFSNPNKRPSNMSSFLKQFARILNQSQIFGTKFDV